MAVEPPPGRISGFFERALSQMIPVAPNSVSGNGDGGFQLDPVAADLNAVFAEFGIDAKVVGRTVGPSVVLYKVKPGPGTKAEKISGVSGNLNLALRTEQWRMLDVVEGEPCMGIEVPRPDRQIVPLPPLLAGILHDRRELLVPIGVDVVGRPVLVDLAGLPHLLIGGVTGGGKSELLKVILCALLARTSPAQVRLLLIDVKRVELTVFRSVPHLLRPIVTDPEEAIEALGWLVGEMERRYRLFEQVGAENIDVYRQMTGEPMARLVVGADELANLITAGGAEVEAAVTALGELARAAGIHLVLATQRPSVDVVTGRIKANLPARIALQVAGQPDSRVILDRVGAEKLLGRGDALWTPNGQKPQRVQCAFVTRAEQQQVVARAMTFATAPTPSPLVDRIRPVSPAASLLPSDPDDPELVALAAGVVVKAGRASVNGLQAALKIGNAKAQRLMAALERLEIVGPADGQNARPVLVRQESAAEVVAQIRSGELS